MASMDPNPPSPQPPEDPLPAAEPPIHPRAILSDPEVQRVLREAAAKGAEDAVKASFDLRITRLQEEVRRGIERASADLLAQVRGSIEGKVLAALTSATSSKEFRGILQEITLWAANQALKERFAVVVKQAEEGLESRMAATAATLAGTEAFRSAVASSSAAEVHKALEGLFGAEATGEFARVVRKMVEEGQAALLARMEERIGSVTGIQEQVRSLMGGLLADQTSLLERLQGRAEASGKQLEEIQARMEALEKAAAQAAPAPASPVGEETPAQGLQELREEMQARMEALEKAAASAPAGPPGGEAPAQGLQELREEIRKAREEATAASNEGIEAVFHHLQQVESVVGGIQERLDRVEGERLRLVFEILSGMSGPKDLEAKIRETAGEGVAKVLQTIRTAFEEMRKKSEEMIAGERERTEARLRDLEAARIAPLAAALQGLATPADLERRIREVAGAAAPPPEGAPAGSGRGLLEDPILQEKVKALAAAERRGAKAEVAAQVEEVLKAKGISEMGVPEEALKKLASQAVGEAVSGIKSLAKQIRPAIEVEVGKELKEKLKDFLPAKEVRDLVETRLEQYKTDMLTASGVLHAPVPDLEPIRKQLAEELGRELGKKIAREVERAAAQFSEGKGAAAGAGGAAVSPDQVREAVRAALGKEAVQASVQNILQSDLFNNFLSSDQMKEMLDDKFKIMRNWLRNDELPRQLARFKEGGPPPPPES
jgi:hypothetical protein